MVIKFDRELWVKALEIARDQYEKENGEESWYYADRHERVDCIDFEYRKLVNETINNTTNNKKENNTMMNKKMNKREQRMEVLRDSGVNVDNFFNINLSIPFGHEVKILVDGKEMIIPATNKDVVTAYENYPNSQSIADANVSTIMSVSDPIAQSIIENGYVKNSKLFRRFIFAHTIRMLNYVSCTDPNRKGWEACMKDCYGYNYQFDMLLEEIRVLSILQKEDKEVFKERTHFFNGDVVVATLEDYLKKLKKYVNKQMKEKPRTYKGQKYVKLAKYGNVLVKDLDKKVYRVIDLRIDYIKNTVKSGNYSAIYETLKDFMNECYNKLPFETTKSSVWKDAFKGSGAYYSLQNACRWHGVIIESCGNAYDSERNLYRLLDGEYKNEVWRFHQLLVDTIEYNNFDLKRSIAEGNVAPGTTSEKAKRYARR